MTLTSRRQSTIEKVYASQRVQHLLLAQPQLSVLLDIAADPEPRTNRWVSYEALKRMADPLLMDSRQHEAFRWAVEMLLPEEEVKDVVSTNEDEDEYEDW